MPERSRRSAADPALLRPVRPLSFGRAVLLALLIPLLSTLAVSTSAGAAGRREPAPEPGVDISTTTVAVLSPTAVSGERTESEKADQRVQIVVISLLVLAVVVTIATVVFWRRTKPARVSSSEAKAVVSGFGES